VKTIVSAEVLTSDEAEVAIAAEVDSETKMLKKLKPALSNLINLNVFVF